MIISCNVSTSADLWPSVWDALWIAFIITKVSCEILYIKNYNSYVLYLLFFILLLFVFQICISWIVIVYFDFGHSVLWVTALGTLCWTWSSTRVVPGTMSVSDSKEDSAVLQGKCTQPLTGGFRPSTPQLLLSLNTPLCCNQTGERRD